MIDFDDELNVQFHCEFDFDFDDEFYVLFHSTCLNAYDCRIQNGESSGPCALGLGVCCVYDNGSGGGPVFGAQGTPLGQGSPSSSQCNDRVIMPCDTEDFIRNSPSRRLAASSRSTYAFNSGLAKVKKIQKTTLACVSATNNKPARDGPSLNLETTMIENN
ncbi:unnamed protein product [Nesidiocoris tenuis]|uniref:Uncharacterized protein n=1 Tax=Nesidiocoris tenuis TaxID=355587 RepID=A0A6H5HRK6_9HEMI|nr:unnamed protein product [Nesidiocoris tenuis]